MIIIIFYLKEKSTFFSPLFISFKVIFATGALVNRFWLCEVGRFVFGWGISLSHFAHGWSTSASESLDFFYHIAHLPTCPSLVFFPPISVSVGGESLAVAQNTYAVNWFKGKELNLVFGLQLSMARLVRTPEFYKLHINISPEFIYIKVKFAHVMCLRMRTVRICLW